MNIDPKLKAAGIRAARTFAQAFIGAIGAAWVQSRDLSITGLLDTIRATANLAGGGGVLAAATALGMNFRRPISPEVKKDGSG